MKYLIIIVTVFSIGGCMTADLTARGPAFNEIQNIPEGKSVAYFYTQDYRGGNACWLIGIDSVRSKCMGFPGYVALLVDAGQRTISTTPNAPIKIANGKFDFNFEKGKSYYFEWVEIPRRKIKEDYVFTMYNMAYDTRFGWQVIPYDQALPVISSLNSWQ
ncbi:hypothetical protein ACCI51_18670 [Microbulbifer echini]|uniref:DUF2846 domain-containing protein n=1 Tax=Microbulbifer echini TaxID=1529067 RepID=A0ABV4NTP0_9GAMM|nr:hypothetical protein [uncultured Microbulbifer sp.]